MTIIEGVKKNADEAGLGRRQILDPNNGKTYKVRLTPKDGGKALDVRGYIGPVRPHPDLAPRENDSPGEPMNRFQVRKVAVLGAGVMGAQIAAHLVNCKVPVVLFDLPAKEGPKNGIVTKAVDNLKKLKPAPLGVPRTRR
jgi:NADPH-dependent 2,4-dienoyl-CoA reductase/sulfur reductase-like enzyme